MKCYWLKNAKAINCNSNIIIPFEKAKTTHIGGKAICLRNWYLSLELLMLNEATFVPVQHKHNNNTLKQLSVQRTPFRLPLQPRKNIINDSV